MSGAYLTTLHYFSVSQSDVSDNDYVEVFETANVENESNGDGDKCITTCETSSATCNQRAFVSKPKQGFLRRFK